MGEQIHDARRLVERIQHVLERFEKSSGQHQRDESYVAVDAMRYSLVIKVASPFGQGEADEVVESTNELQQRVNYWLTVQRELGKLGSVRIVLTPIIDDDS
ncbi:MAG: hypothetical protein JXR96_09475 [Deltaproteobacteria bacterium]|nr:hypothetical protein [Deltaproteobacteria bacterium]